MNQKSRNIVKKLLTANTTDVDTTYRLRRPQPVRYCGIEEATMMAMVGRKTHTIAQLLRGRYVLRHKGKALRQHKLSSKHRLKLGKREKIRAPVDDSVVGRMLDVAGVKFTAPLFSESDQRLMEAIIPPQVVNDLLKGSEP